MSGGLCWAQCGPEEDPEITLPVERLGPNFQPSRYSTDPSKLRRIRFTPPGYGTNTRHPTVISIPPAIFNDADPYGRPSQRMASKELADAGYLVFQVDHRLAPPGEILYQEHLTPSSGRRPQQTNDIKQQILAALTDSHCNGEIFLIGGSSGGCHALWVALDQETSIVPDWTEEVRAAIKAVASLSGPTDLSSREGNMNIVEGFEISVENYTNVSNEVYPDTWDELQKGVSPIKFVENATGIPPIRMFGTELDSVPWQQGDEMQIELFARGADSEFHLVNSTAQHAFNYWHKVDQGDTMTPKRCVSEVVIDLFDAHATK